MPEDTRWQGEVASRLLRQAQRQWVGPAFLFDLITQVD